jgi:hypothetical protein
VHRRFDDFDLPALCADGSSGLRWFSSELLRLSLCRGSTFEYRRLFRVRFLGEVMSRRYTTVFRPRHANSQTGRSNILVQGLITADWHELKRRNPLGRKVLLGHSQAAVAPACRGCVEKRYHIRGRSEDVHVA